MGETVQCIIIDDEEADDDPRDPAQLAREDEIPHRADRQDQNVQQVPRAHITRERAEFTEVTLAPEHEKAGRA